MPEFTLTIHGAEKVDRMLRKLPVLVGKKIVRHACRTGAKVIQKPAQAFAKGRVGGDMGSLIARHLVVRASKTKRPGEYAVNVMMRPGVDEFVSQAKHVFYAKGKQAGKSVRYYIPAAIEYGHRKPYGASKEVAPISFMRAAHDTHRRRAVHTVEGACWQGIRRAVTRG
jgi:hypothetical protein